MRTIRYIDCIISLPVDYNVRSSVVYLYGEMSNDSIRFSMNSKRLASWYQTVLGREVAMNEHEHISRLLAELPGGYLLQFGREQLSWLHASRIMYKWVVNEQACDTSNSLVVASFDELPFPRESFDVVILPHIVDCNPNYPDIIREAARVVSGEGYLLILGFNPYSLGLFSTAKPPAANLPSCYKLRYWLNKSSCEIEKIESFFYRPLIQHEASLKRIKIIEKIGQLLWPTNGLCYVIIARKKITAVIPLKQKIKNWWGYLASKPISEPSARTRRTKL